MRVRAVVPVKNFADAKERLATVLTPEQRAILAETLARTTLGELAAFDPLVACDSDAIERWAASIHAASVRTPAGLNRSVTAAVGVAGTELVAVCHADLAFPASLGSLFAEPRPLIVSDRHGTGTNILVVPATAGYVFAYGADSFALHRAEAKRLDIDLEVVDDPRLSWDVDTPDDLDTPPDWGPPPWLT